MPCYTYCPHFIRSHIFRSLVEISLSYGITGTWVKSNDGRPKCFDQVGNEAGWVRVL